MNKTIFEKAFNQNMHLPKSINVDPQSALINTVWDDIPSSNIPLSYLRRSCPCASCSQERGENPHPSLISPAEEKTKRSISLPILGDVKKYEVASLHHVGQYALGVTWQDNHTSIFTWDFLKEISIQYSR